jgi:glycosyltransferase involved in cell wall biosynthesis
MNVSVIVCTYNPEYEVLNRCISALINQDVEGLSSEIIVVDNNSTLDIAELDFIQHAQTISKKFCVISEKKPGLTYARICGVNASSGDILVFIDDDNEPDSNYLKNAYQLGIEHPALGAWGAGQITVEFLNKRTNWIDTFKTIFQEVNLPHLDMSSRPDWSGQLPVGTGLVCRKKAITQFLTFLSSQKSVVADRTGTSLSSAGDTQMVLYIQQVGHLIARSPLLKINHLISSRKQTIHYLKNVEYGCANSYDSARLSISPDLKEKLTDELPRGKVLIKWVVKLFITLPPVNRHKKIALAKEFGHIMSKYNAIKEQPPRWFNTLLNWYFSK